MAIVDVDGSCQFQEDSQPKSTGLIWGLAATRRSVYIQQMNRVNFRSDFGHDDSTLNIIIIIIIIFRPRYSVPREWKNYAMQYKKVQKSSWNEPYSSSSFTKRSCSKMALYRWIRAESRYNKKLIIISSIIIYCELGRKLRELQLVRCVSFARVQNSTAVQFSSVRVMWPMVKTKTVPASSHLVVMCGLFQDVSDKYSLHYPKLYAPGQRDLFFNKRVFAQSIAEAIASSVLLFFMSLGALSNCVNPAGLDVGNLTSFGFLIASILIVTVTLRVGRSVGRQRTYRGTKHTHTHTHTHTRLTALCPGLPGWVAGTRKVKPIWILLKQERVSGSGISWAMCKSAPRSRQITIILNDTINFSLKLQSAFCYFQTMTVSECGLIKLLLYILFEKYIHLYLSVGNGQPWEPALCQLYRHTFVPYYYHSLSCVA